MEGWLIRSHYTSDILMAWILCYLVFFTQFHKIVEIVNIPENLRKKSKEIKAEESENEEEEVNKLNMFSEKATTASKDLSF